MRNKILVGFLISLFLTISFLSSSFPQYEKHAQATTPYPTVRSICNNWQQAYNYPNGSYFNGYTDSYVSCSFAVQAGDYLFAFAGYALLYAIGTCPLCNATISDNKSSSWVSLNTTAPLVFLWRSSQITSNGIDNITISTFTGDNDTLYVPIKALTIYAVQDANVSSIRTRAGTYATCTGSFITSVCPSLSVNANTLVLGMMTHGEYGGNESGLLLSFYHPLSATYVRDKITTGIPVCACDDAIAFHAQNFNGTHTSQFSIWAAETGPSLYGEVVLAIDGGGGGTGTTILTSITITLTAYNTPNGVNWILLLFGLMFLPMTLWGVYAKFRGRGSSITFLTIFSLMLGALILAIAEYGSASPFVPLGIAVFYIASFLVYIINSRRKGMPPTI